MPNGHPAAASAVLPVEVKTIALVVEVGLRFVGIYIVLLL